MSKKNVIAGLPKLLRAFPEDADLIVQYGAEICDFALSGKVPQNAPKPRTLAMKAKPDNAGFVMLQGDLDVDGAHECIHAVLQLATGVVGEVFGMFGIPAPTYTAVQNELRGRGLLLNRLAADGQGGKNATGDDGEATTVWNVFVDLWNEGIISDLLSAALALYSWWDSTLLYTQISAQITAGTITLGTFFSWQFAVAVVTNTDILQGIHKLADGACSSHLLITGIPSSPKEIAMTRSLLQQQKDPQTARAWFTTTTLLDIADGSDSITKNEWNRAFKTLDRDGDGSLSVEDLDQKEHVPHSVTISTGAKLNISTANVMAALPKLLRAFPEDADVILNYEAVLRNLALSGKVPKNAPKPPSLAPEQKQDNSRLVLLQGDLDVDGTHECIQAVLQLATGTVGIVFGIFGIHAPNYTEVEHLLQGRGPLLSRMAAHGQGVNVTSGNDTGGDGGVAMRVYNMFVDMWDDGSFLELLQDRLADQWWWEKVVGFAQITAQITAAIATFGGTILWQIARAVITNVDVIEGIDKLAGGACSSLTPEKTGESSN